jgi:cytochrome P450
MLHDQEVYADPEEFNPDRFIPEGTKPAAPDPARAAFGFGRRYAIFAPIILPVC